jgi:hypothetical protein
LVALVRHGAAERAVLRRVGVQAEEGHCREDVEDEVELLRLPGGAGGRACDSGAAQYYVF